MTNCIPRRNVWAALIAAALAAVLLAERAVADGGVLRAHESSGGLMLSVFTEPRTLTEGSVDVSVLVQDAETGDVLSDALVRVDVAPRGYEHTGGPVEASHELATNKLFQACHIPLAAGEYEVLVRATHAERIITARFQIEVAAQPGSVSRFWPWFCWPLIPILLVAAHLGWPRRRRKPTAAVALLR
jgi:hypothetical protein